MVDLASVTEAPCTVDLVQWLADRSLVRRASDERFDLLESNRQYAAEKLRTDRDLHGSGLARRAAAERRPRQLLRGDRTEAPSSIRAANSKTSCLRAGARCRVATANWRCNCSALHEGR